MEGRLVDALRGATRRRRPDAPRLPTGPSGDRCGARRTGSAARAAQRASDGEHAADLPRRAAEGQPAVAARDGPHALGADSVAARDAPHALGADGVAATERDARLRRALDPVEPAFVRRLLALSVATRLAAAVVSLQRILFARDLVAALPILRIVARHFVAITPPGVRVTWRRAARARGGFAALA